MALVTTQIGIDKALQASGNQISLKITHVALGTNGYTPNKSATALQNEVIRVPISGGKKVSPTQIHLTSIFNGDEDIEAKEVGFFLEDGTLFAIDSHPTETLIYKNPSSILIEAYDIYLDAVPPDSITVDTTGDLNLYYADMFAVINTALAQQAAHHLQLKFDLMAKGLI